MRTRTIHIWVGLLLCLGAITFPLSRIPRIEMVAHIADILFLIPVVYLGIDFLGNKKPIAHSA